MRKIPDFIIAGAAKCGTTALAHFLAEVPGIYMSENKEPRFFTAVRGDMEQGILGDGPRLSGNYHKGFEWYEKLFEQAKPNQLKAEAYNMFACNGILFNHESPLRGETFVTRKITRAVAAIALGLQKTLFLGNLDAQRDWGHTRDYVKAMWLILQHDTPEDFVIATGKTTPVREFVKMAFAEIGVQLEFRGSGVEEKGYVAAIANNEFSLQIGSCVVAVDPAYFRPTEVELLIGDATKAKTKLGWEPECSVEKLVKEMILADLEVFKHKNKPQFEHLIG